MVKVIFCGMISNTVMIVLFRGEYYKVCIQDVTNAGNIVCYIERRYLLEENKIKKE